MGRAKLRMELIKKEKTRITTYQKRKLGIIKKASEFTILCDVDTAMIIYPPNSNEPEVWPEIPDQIKKSIASYKSKKGETGKRTYNLNDFFEDRRRKIEDELMKARKKNIEANYSTWFDELDGFPEHYLRQFVHVKLEPKEKEVRTRLELKKTNMNIQYPHSLSFGNNPSMFHYPGLGLDLGLGLGNPNPRQVMNNWPSNDVPSTSYMLMNHEPIAPYGYQLVDYGGTRGFLYDNNLNLFFPIQQPPLVQGGAVQELAMQERLESNSDGSGVCDQ